MKPASEERLCEGFGFAADEMWSAGVPGDFAGDLGAVTSHK